jgi:hypothetical protein
LLRGLWASPLLLWGRALLWGGLGVGLLLEDVGLCGGLAWLLGGLGAGAGLLEGLLLLCGLRLPPWLLHVSLGGGLCLGALWLGWDRLPLLR